MNITHTIAILPLRAKKQVLRSLVASLNQSIIGYARSHIRDMKYAPVSEVPTNDLRNEQLAEADETAQTARFMTDAGQAPRIEPLVQCQRVTILRNWLAEQIMITDGYNPQYDAPFNVANSLAYQIDRAPSTDESAILKLAESTGIAVERLRRAGVTMHDDERTDLIKNSNRILAVYDDCSASEPLLDEAQVEALIDELPVQLVYKLGIKINTLLIAASDRAVELMLKPQQRGSKEAAGDVKLIDVARAEHFKLLTAFDKQHAAELDAYAERGYLPIMPNEFEQPVVVAMDAQSAKENVTLTKAEALQVVKASKQPVTQSKLDAVVDRFNHRNMTSV